MVVALFIVDLRLQAHSLKEKRRVIQSVLSRIRRNHNLSVYEADYHDVHGRARLAAAWVGPDPDAPSRILESMLGIAEGAGAEVVGIDCRFSDPAEYTANCAHTNPEQEWEVRHALENSVYGVPTPGPYDLAWCLPDNSPQPQPLASGCRICLQMVLVWFGNPSYKLNARRQRGLVGSGQPATDNIIYVRPGPGICPTPFTYTAVTGTAPWWTSASG